MGAADAAVVGGAHRHHSRVGAAFGICGALFQWSHPLQHFIGQLHRTGWPRRLAASRRIEEALLFDESGLRSNRTDCGIGRSVYKLKTEN